MKGEIIAPKRPNMGILKSHSLEETVVTFINIYVQACDFSVLNSMIIPPLDCLHATAFLSCQSANAIPSDRNRLRFVMFGGLLGLAGGVKVVQCDLETLRPEEVSICLIFISCSVGIHRRFSRTHPCIAKSVQFSCIFDR